MRPLYILKASAVSPLGDSLNEIWERVLVGDAAFSTIRLANGRSCHIAACGEPSQEWIDNYCARFATTLRKLVRDLDSEERIGAIFLGTAVGALANVERAIYRGARLSADDLDFLALKAMFRDLPGVDDETRFICLPTGCCSGAQALGLATRILPLLQIERALVISIDFGVTPLTLEAFGKIQATARFEAGRAQSPSLPFSSDRGGFLLADGGGAALVSSRAPARTPFLSGYGCVSSAFHMTDISDDGIAIRKSIEIALRQAGRRAAQIDHVNAHGSGTVQNDVAEYRALTDVFGEDFPIVTSFKGNHGHALGGANMIEVALCWKMLRDECIPPTAHHAPTDAFKAIPKRSSHAPWQGSRILKLASGFSGIHTALVMERGDVDDLLS